MKKIGCVLLGLLLLLYGVPVCGADAITVSARAAVVVEAGSGRVLFEKNADERLSMASTTKIMTALLAIESEQLDQPVTITADMLRTEGSSIYLKVGDCLTLRSLVAGLMLESGNDAALAIAITLDGSEASFAERMNRRAAQLGMTNTHFVTASGLDDDTHYTSARDLALLGRAAMQVPEFQEIVSRQSMTIDFIGSSVRRTFYNHNRLLREMDGCIGIKTGFTKKSGRCLVTCCERGGVRLIAVTLSAPDDWNDHKRMMNNGFAQVEPITFSASGLHVTVPVVGAGEFSYTELADAGSVQTVILAGRASDVQMKIEAEPFLYAPVVAGRIAGRVSYWLDGTQIAEISLLTQEAIPFVPRKRSVWEQIGSFLARFFGFDREF